MAIDENKLNEFMGKIVGDLGATMSSALLVLGDRLGLYKAMAALGPVTPAELAKRTETAERYVREWLNAQAAGGYVTYDAETRRYTLPPEQAFALADDDSPASVAGAFSVARAMWSALDKMEANFRTGGGPRVGAPASLPVRGHRAVLPGRATSATWSRPGSPRSTASRRSSRAARRSPTSGCGCGASTILMAKAFPKSTFRGFDYHQGSIDIANRRAQEAGVADRVTFEVAKATDYPGTGYDLVAHFDCLHDMEDPAGAARHARKTLAKDGTWLIVEPFASDKAEENHNPVGRVFYSASTLLCVPHSLAHDGPGAGRAGGRGAAARGRRRKGGFSRFRRATETPFNLILEARP